MNRRRATKAVAGKGDPAPASVKTKKARKRVGKEPAGSPIVGIGASAGGLEAFERLLSRLPNDLGMGYVLVTHLEPTHESHLTEILSRATQMPVTEVVEGVRVEPNHIYIIPPNTNMVLRQGKLCLVPRQIAFGQHMPIDFFFHSLAEAQKHRAVGVILSGTASDGAAGMRAIKVAGGITFAQDAQSAKYSGMPQSSIAAGAVDFILPPEGIAKELEKIARDAYFRAARLEEFELPPPGEESNGAVQEILALLGKTFGVDFTHYKQSTVHRRIRRRMALQAMASFKEYAQYLREHDPELSALYKDMFINVSGFFREPDAFKHLQRILFPTLFKHRMPETPIRVWVPGCSTGEEAYSIAICLLEYLHEKQKNVQVQVFATDISDDAIHFARKGHYLEDTRAQVEPRRLRRWFTKTENGYQINKTVRDLVVFAKQDVTKDPPFSRLDLISCRNLLIYLGPVLQKKLIPVFHYALKPNGYLFLGAAESIGTYSDLFVLADRKYKIYTKKAGLHRQQLEAVAERFQLQEVDKELVKHPEHVKSSLESLKEAADMMLLNEFTPPSVLVNQDMEILQFRGRTGPYLEPASGTPTLNLLKMAREGLIADLQSAIHESHKKSIAVHRQGVKVTQNGDWKIIDLHVAPLKTPLSGEPCFLITFQEPPALPPRKARQVIGKRRMTPGEIENAERISQLKQELAANKAYLESVIDKHESSNEELRSLNEEIMSSNEELQSTSEELETANEELQSANEELITLNEELHTRNLELTRANNDILNILGSMSVSLIILDRKLNIRRFTPTAQELFNLISTDIGRPISNIRLKLTLPSMDEKLRAIIEGGAASMVEIQDKDSRWYSMQLRPYMTTEKEIDGAVIAVTDITTLVQQSSDLKAAVSQREEAQAKLHEVHRRLLEAAISRERDTMARQVHDSLSQVLAGIIVQLEAADALASTDNSEIKKHLEKAQSVARKGLDEVRKSAWAYRKGDEWIKSGGLPNALEEVGHRLFDSTSINFHLIAPKERQPLPSYKASHLFMFAQEAMANVLLHSDATDVWVELKDLLNSTHLEVRDNGKGFVPAVARESSGFGMISMEERVLLLGGLFELKTAPGEGTTVGALVPNPGAKGNK